MFILRLCRGAVTLVSILKGLVKHENESVNIYSGLTRKAELGAAAGAALVSLVGNVTVCFSAEPFEVLLAEEIPQR